jgi:2,4-dienoyl-CoA reductase (NADPH2)
LRKRGVRMLSGVIYEHIDDAGLHVRVEGQPHVLDVEHVVICAGQEPRRDLADDLAARGVPHTVVGGADVAAELDAKRAIEQATRVALAL